MKPVWLSILASTALLHGCGEGMDPVPAGDAAAAVEGPEPSSNTPTDPNCHPGSSAELVLDGIEIADLHPVGDEVLFVDTSAGPPSWNSRYAGEIRAVRGDGSATRLLYAAPADHIVTDMVTDGQDVYFLVFGPTWDYASVVFRMPVTGGEPTQVSPAEEGFRVFADLFGVDDLYLYLIDESHVFAISKAHPDVRLLARVDGVATNLQVFDGAVWYSQWQAEQEFAFFVPRETTDAVPMVFSEDGCAIGGAHAIGLGGLTVTPYGVFCSLNRYGDEGARKQFLDSLSPDTPRGMSGPFGDYVFLSAPTRTPRIDQLNLRTMEQTTLLCDRPQAFHLNATDSHLYWIESQVVDDEAQDRVFRAGRP